MDAQISRDWAKSQKARTQTEEAGTNLAKSNRGIASTFRNWVRKAKAQVELKLERNVKGNTKGFYSYIDSQKNATEDVLSGAGNPLTRGMEKVKILSFFGLHFSWEGLSSALWGPLYYQQSLWEGVRHDQQKRKKETRSTQHTGDTKIYEMRWDGSNGTEGSSQCHCKGILPSLRVHGDWGRFSMTRKGKHHHLYNGHKEDLGNYGMVYLT